MSKNEKIILISSAGCIAACIGEFVFLFVLGAHYPGYNHLKDTMSQLGTSASPVSSIISAWWIIMGFIFIFYGTGFYKAFLQKSNKVKLASLIIMLYGFGEGIGSGLFKANRISEGIPISAIIHDTLGGIGVLGILALPLIMQKIIKKADNPVFYRFSGIMFVTGIFTILLFLCRYLPDNDNFFTIYKGLWQRLFMLNTYLYLTVLAILTIKNKNLNSGFL